MIYGNFDDLEDLEGAAGGSFVGGQNAYILSLLHLRRFVEEPAQKMERTGRRKTGRC